MTAPALTPYRPLTAAEKAADRAGIALARRALQREFPGITERQGIADGLARTNPKEQA